MAPALGLVNVAPVAVDRPTTSVTRGGAFRSKADQALSLGNIESAEPSSVNSAVRQRQGVWMPPSQNEEKRRGMVFSIQKPQDLLDFVIEDERLSVGKPLSQTLFFNICIFVYEVSVDVSIMTLLFFYT